LVKLMFEVMIMEPRSYLLETSWKTILASARSGTHPPSYQHGSRGPSCRCGRVPHVCPRNIMTMIRTHIMHQEASSTRAALRQAQPSQREVSAAAVGQLLHHARAGLRSLD
jgi:hypothetical protein